MKILIILLGVILFAYGWRLGGFFIAIFGIVLAIKKRNKQQDGNRYPHILVEDIIRSLI